MSADKVQEGDKVSWNWGSGNPGGVAAEVKEGDVTITSKKGNEITKHGEEGDPAVHVERPGNDVVKKASELNVESKASGSNGSSSESKEEESKDEDNESNDKKEDNEAEKESEEQGGSPAQAGDKRKADEKADAGTDQETEEKNGGEDSKKQKTTNGKANPATAANGEKKKAGRPKGASNGEKKPAKEKKTPAVGRAERKTRSQGKAS